MTVSQLNGQGKLRHLITLADLPRAEIEAILARAQEYLTPIGQPPPRDTILRGHTVAHLFELLVPAERDALCARAVFACIGATTADALAGALRGRPARVCTAALQTTAALVDALEREFSEAANYYGKAELILKQVAKSLSEDLSARFLSDRRRKVFSEDLARFRKESVGRASEAAVDARPAPVGSEVGSLAVHDFVHVALGVHVIDNADLTALSEAAAERSRWEFLVTVAPIRFRYGTGSPVNPVAVF